MICKKLLDLTTSERQDVVDGRLDDLDHSTQEKGRLIEQMEALEGVRRDLVRQLASELSLPADTSLAGLATRVQGQESADLLDLRRRVADAVVKLRDANDGNLMLMRRSLETVRDSMRQLRRSTGVGEVYSADGRSAMSTINVRANVAVDCHA